MSVGSLSQRARTRSPRRLLLPLLVLPLVVGTGCVDRSVSPDELRIAHLALAASLPHQATQQARAIDAWRVAVSRPGQGVVAEESGTVGPADASVTVEVSVTLEAACEALSVRIELLSAGEVWYRADREQQVCAGRGNQVPTVQLEWVGPTIGLAPTQLSFSADQATNPPPQTVTVTNTGGGALSWSASEDAAWLTVAPATGSLGAGASQSLAVTVAGASLDPGQFQTNIVVTDPNAGNSPLTLPVSLTVIEVANSVIRGTVTADGTGLAGVSVTISGKQSASGTTNASGQFAFTGLTAGSYTVTLGNLPSDVRFPSTAQSLTLGVNQTRTVDFTGTYLRTSSVVGAVKVDNAGLSGVTVTLSGTEARSTTTDSSGGYAFTSLRAGGYTVVISGFPSGVSFQVTSRNTTVGVGQQAVLDFAGSIVRSSSISGVISVEGAPLANVTVTLGGPQTGTVATNASGQYVFTNLRDGSYTVTVSNYPSGVGFSSPTQNVSLGVNESRTVDFQGTYIATSSVVGQVTAGGAGLAGVTVTLSGTESRTTSTNSSGNYQFTGLRAGSYTVTISNLPQGVLFQVTSRSVSVAVGQTVQLDFAGEVVQRPSEEYSYIEACPAVIPVPYEVSFATTLSVGARDQVANPIHGATVLLSSVPTLPDYNFFGATYLITGPDGLASTTFYSELTGAKTFSALISANDYSITVQESDDLYVDIERDAYSLGILAGDGQTIVGGQSGSFSVRVLTPVGAPAQGVPVGWAVGGGNCFYGFANAEGVAGMNLYVPPSTAPGLYWATANLAAIDWDAGSPWKLVEVTFNYYVVAPSGAPPAAPFQEGERLRGTPVPPGR